MVAPCGVPGCGRRIALAPLTPLLPPVTGCSPGQHEARGGNPEAPSAASVLRHGSQRALSLHRQAGKETGGILSPGLAALPPGSLTPRKQRPQKPAGAPAAFRGQEHPIPEGGNPRARSTDWWPCFSTCPLASIGTPTGVLGVIPH